MKPQYAVLLAGLCLLLSPPLYAQEAPTEDGEAQDQPAVEEQQESQDLQAEVSDLKLRLQELEAMAEDYQTLQESVQELQTAIGETQPKISPDITAEATTSWQYNLRTGRSGFLNEIDIAIEVPFIPKDSARERSGRGNARGYIKVEGYSLGVGPDGVNGSFGTIDARIYVDNYFVRLFRTPSALLNAAEAIDSDDEDIATRGANIPMQGGLSVGYVDRNTTLEYKVGSSTDQTLNEQNQYGTALYLKQELLDGGFKYETGLAYAVAFGNSKLEESDVVSRDIGFGISPEIDLRNVGYGLVFSAGLDVVRQYSDLTGEYDDSRMDSRFDTQVKISPRYSVDGEDAWSSINLGAYYRPDDSEDGDHRLDVTGTLEELEGDQGLLPGVGGSLGGTVTDILSKNNGWSTKASLSYRFDRLKPYVETEYGDSEILTLTSGMELYLIPAVVMDLNYKSDNLNHEPNDEENPGDRGLLTFAVTIEY